MKELTVWRQKWNARYVLFISFLLRHVSEHQDQSYKEHFRDCWRSTSFQQFMCVDAVVYDLLSNPFSLDLGHHGVCFKFAKSRINHLVPLMWRILEECEEGMLLLPAINLFSYKQLRKEYGWRGIWEQCADENICTSETERDGTGDEKVHNKKLNFTFCIPLHVILFCLLRHVVQGGETNKRWLENPKQ
jgi:hypothetical protein